MSPADDAIRRAGWRKPVASMAAGIVCLGAVVAAPAASGRQAQGVADFAADLLACKTLVALFGREKLFDPGLAEPLD